MFSTNPSSAPEARQRIAHGGSRGFPGKTSKAPAGAKEFSGFFFLSPLPGLIDFVALFPRLGPWLFSFAAPRLSRRKAECSSRTCSASAFSILSRHENPHRPPHIAGFFLQPVSVFRLYHRPAVSQGLSGFAVPRTRPTGGLRHGHHHTHGLHGLAVEPAADHPDAAVRAHLLQLDLSLRHPAPFHRLADGQTPRGGTRTHRGQPLQKTCIRSNTSSSSP